SSTYYLAFEGISGYGYGVCIDDITVQGTYVDPATEIILYATTDGNLYNTCNSKLFDSGGESGQYGDNEDYEVTFASTNGGCIRAILKDYNIENIYDKLYFYDGPSSASPQIGSYVQAYPMYPGTTIDQRGNAYYAQSGYITIRFTSDIATVADGFEVDIDCPINCVAPPASASVPAGEFCETAEPICDFNGYHGNTTSSYQTDHAEIGSYNTDDWPSPNELLYIFCGGVNNNSWLSFVADSTTAVLDVWVYNCQGNSSGSIYGVQLQVYETDCTYGNFTAKSNCWSPGKVINGQIVATDLVPGNQYLLMIDGFAGDNCEYIFAASSGVIVADAGQDKTICEGQAAFLTANGGNNFDWTANPADPSLSGQESNQSVSVTPSVTTTYTATVTGENPNCPGTADVVVFVNEAFASYSGLDLSYCEDDDGPVALTGDYPTSISWFGGPGISDDSLFTPSAAVAGTHDITYVYNYSVVSAFSDDFDPAPEAGWQHGYDAIGTGTHTRGDSWEYGSPTAGYGQNASSENPDPIIDHTSNIDNNVYGQGLGNTTNGTYSDI
ncbi:MAG: hypothetical protein C0594_05225, partial [Marinilabiliales bacterium]